jgi:hypothetical protein
VRTQQQQPQGSWAQKKQPEGEKEKEAESGPSAARLETVAKLQMKTSTILQQYK